MREFSLLDIIKYYLKYFWIVLIVTVISLFIGVIYIENFYIPVYQESTTIILGKGTSMKEGEFSSSTITLYDSLINNYIKLLESRKLLSNIKKDLNLDYTVSQLSEMVSYSISGNSQMIEISVLNKEDELAVQICKQIVIELKEQVFDIYGLDNITIVDEAKENNRKIYNESIIIVFITLFGFILSSLVIVIKFIFSDKVMDINSHNNILEINILNKIIYQTTDNLLQMSINEEEENKFKNIRSKILNDLSDQKIIMISSISEDNGKSYITYHLAQSLAKINKKILIIDANRKDGRLSSYINNNNIGLLDILNNDKLLPQAINSNNNIDFIPIGNIENIDLLASNYFSNLLNKLKDNYDYLLIETPSFKNNFETISILKEVDSVIITSKLNKEKIDDLSSIKEEILKQEKQIIGIILTKENKKKTRKKKEQVKKENQKEQIDKSSQEKEVKTPKTTKKSSTAKKTTSKKTTNVKASKAQTTKKQPTKKTPKTTSKTKENKKDEKNKK